jgi:anthraniloyl-CoA monooxygenase
VDIGIVGGGPAGLYFALLMRRHDGGHRVRVIEQNPEGATYGWGIVFSDRALSFLAEADPASSADIEARLETWSEQAIVHRDQEVRIDGLAFSGLARLTLLRILQEHCRRAGVELTFGRRLADPAELGDSDLVVGADGIQSVVRARYREHFAPTEATLSNRYIWYGTSRPFECLTLTFRENADGVFVAHHYRHAAPATASPGGRARPADGAAALSTFVVECDAPTWHRARLGQMTDAESRRYCETVFAPDLQGHPLLSNRSTWSTFRAITSRRWCHGNAVLLGDALRSVHFSIGSGTRMALEDAIALAAAFREHRDVPEALAAFEAARRPVVEGILGIAAQSFTWYERFRERMALDPVPFAYDYVMRSGRITPERLADRSPRFARAYQAYLAAGR